HPATDVICVHRDQIPFFESLSVCHNAGPQANFVKYSIANEGRKAVGPEEIQPQKGAGAASDASVLAGYEERPVWIPCRGFPVAFCGINWAGN
ncbi:MAG TPA: hypothetical protein VNI02_23505, partial [Blastocatellia bacterium]|nr:hypothetical protein [Blastocatellia bacterium]